MEAIGNPNAICKRPGDGGIMCEMCRRMPDRQPDGTPTHARMPSYDAGRVRCSEFLLPVPRPPWRAEWVERLEALRKEREKARHATEVSRYHRYRNL